MPFDDAVGLRVDAGLGHVGRFLRQVEAASAACLSHGFHALAMHDAHCSDQRPQIRRGVAERMLNRRAKQEDPFHQVGLSARQLASIDTAQAVSDDSDLTASLNAYLVNAVSQAFESLGRTIGVHPDTGVKYSMTLGTKPGTERIEAGGGRHESW